MNLYDVGREGAELEALLSEAEGELTPELETRMDAFLSGGKAKIEAAAKVLRGLEASAGACELEAARLAARAKTFQRNADGLKGRMLFAVNAGFGGKVKTDLFTIWGQTSARTVSFDVAPDADLAAVSEMYPHVVRRKFELDKLELKAMREQGVAIPQAVTVTEREGTRYLRLK